MELVLIGGLMILIGMSALVSVGWDVFEMRNRENWWWATLLLMEAALMPNPYLGAVLAMCTLGLWRIGRSWFILRGIVIPMAGLAGAYLAIGPHLTLASIAPALWAFVFVGCALGAWGVMGIIKPERPWTIHAPKTWFGYWGIYEHCTGQMRHVCGQGNTLHLVSVSSLTLTAAVGLMVMGQWWAAFAVPLCALPMVLVWMNQTDQHNVITWKHPGQAGLNLAALLVGLGWLYYPILTVGLVGAAVVCAVCALAVFKPWQQAHCGIDSGRLAYWKDALLICWWPSGWRARLVGYGTSTWFLATVRLGDKGHIQVFSAAHNEYVQTLVEHGIIGLGVLCAYLGESLWRTSHAGPEGQAVFLMGVMVCTIASISFPWTFFHEYHPITTKEEAWYGSPTLNVMCFVVALLAGIII